MFRQANRHRWVWVLALAVFFSATPELRAGQPAVSLYRWQDDDFPLSYRQNVSKVPESMRSTFLEYGRIGIEDWAAVAGSRMTSCYRGATTSREKTDETIFARWNELPTGVGGWAYYPPVGVIEYNSRYAAAYDRDRDNLRNLTLHESGHAIGFPHYFDEDSVMAYKYIPYLTSFDVDLIRLNYPGQKITSESCCSKSDTLLVTAPVTGSRLSAPAGQWCYASWLDVPGDYESVGDGHGN